MWSKFCLTVYQRGNFGPCTNLDCSICFLLFAVNSQLYLSMSGVCSLGKLHPSSWPEEGGISIGSSPCSQQVVSQCIHLYRRPQFKTFLCLQNLTYISQSPRHCTNSWSLPGECPKSLSRTKWRCPLHASLAAQGDRCMESTPHGLSLAGEISRFTVFCGS